MARHHHKRYDKIREHHLAALERQVVSLCRCISDTFMNLQYFSPHGEALSKLQTDVREAINVLNNRPKDYWRHNGHMTPQQVEWHSNFEKECRSLNEVNVRESDMQVDIRINEDDTQLAIHFPESGGYTIYMDAAGLDDLMAILWDARQRMQPPPTLPGESPLSDDE